MLFIYLTLLFQIEQDFNMLYPDVAPFQPNFEKHVDLILSVYAKTACQIIPNIHGTSSLPGKLFIFFTLGTLFFKVLLRRWYI